MAGYTMGEAYLASLAAGARVDPDQPTDAREILRARTKLIELRGKLYMGLNSELARYERQQLATEAKLFENVNTTRARVFESIQQNKRVTAKNATEMKTTLAEIQSDLRQKIGGSSPAFSPVQQAYNMANGGQAGLQAAASELISWRDAFGRPLDINNAEIGGIMNRVATLAVPGSQDISRVSRDQFLAAFGNIPQSQRDQIGYLFDAGQQRYNEIAGALATLSDAEGTVDGIATALANTGVSSDPALIAQLNKVAADLGPAVSRGLGRSAADIAAAQEQFLEDNKELERVQADIDALDTKKTPSDQDRMGRIIANPDFRAWAEGNGFRLGTATILPDGKVTYAPMVDDTKALALFNYQAKTGKHGPMFASTSTGKTVRVTYEDPASREKALATYGKNGQFFFDREGALITPTEAERMMNPGNTVQVGVSASGAPVFKMADGRVVDADGNPASGDGVDFMPGTVKTPTGTRYLLPSDLSGLDLANLGGVESNDEAQAAAKGSAELAGISVTDEAGAREAWTGVVVGKLDRPNARRIIEEGAGYISLDGGKVTIPASAKATIEVMPKGTEVEPLTKAERLAEADKAAKEEPVVQAAKTRAAVPEVTVPAVTAGGVVKQLEVPATSAAAKTAAMEGRPVTPVAAAAPATAPKVAAPVSAPAVAPATEKAYYKDNEGSTFELGDDGVTLLTYKGEKPPAGMKTEFKGDDAALEAVLKNLKEKGQRTEAPKPEAALKTEPRKEGLPAPHMREPEPEPTIGRRQQAAVVVYPEAEAEKKPGILEKVRSLFPRRKKAGEEGEAEAKAGSTEVPGTTPTPAPAAAPTETKTTETKTTEQKRREALADLVSGAAAGVPERAPNVEVPVSMLAKSAIGARGEGPSTLKVGDIKSTGYQTATKKYTTAREQEAAAAKQAALTGAQKEPVNMPAQVEMENTGGFTLEGAPRENLFRVDRAASAIPPKKLSRFDKFRQAAFPAAAQE